MGKAKKTRQFAAVKRMISPKDSRLEQNKKKEKEKREKKDKEKAPRHVEKTPSALFFEYNTQLGPP